MRAIGEGCERSALGVARGVVGGRSAQVGWLEGGLRARSGRSEGQASLTCAGGGLPLELACFCELGKANVWLGEERRDTDVEASHPPCTRVGLVLVWERK